MSFDLKEKLAEIEGKISREEAVLSGFRSMISAVSRREQKDQCEDGIQQSETILRYFKSERNKLKVLIANSEPNDDTNAFSGLGGNKELFTSTHKSRSSVAEINHTVSALDFRKHNPTLSREMITSRLREIQHKIEVEEKVKAGFEKFQGSLKRNSSIVYPISTDDTSVSYADSTDKLRIYSIAFRELKPLSLTSLSLEDESNVDAPLLKAGLRRPMTGTLKIKVLAEQNLQNVDPIDSAIQLQIDGKVRSSVKLSNIDRRADHFVAQVDKANEMELLLVNQPRDKPLSIVGLLWIPLSEISDDLRKRNAGKPGWAPADANGEINRSKTVVRKNTNGSDIEIIEDWFKVEPVGKVLLRVDFIKTQTKKPNLALGRQGAFRQGKEAVAAEINGHRFIKRQSFLPLTCPVCKKFALNSTEYHCRDCRFFCHIACADDALTTCIAVSDNEKTRFASLGQIYNIPHRFESASSISANWCSHCGQMMSLVSGSFRKCNECDVTCHTDCQHFVPNFCGLRPEMAKQLLGFQRRRKSDADFSKPKPQVISGFIPMTPPAPAKVPMDLEYPPIAIPVPSTLPNKRLSEPGYKVSPVPAVQTLGTPLIHEAKSETTLLPEEQYEEATVPELKPIQSSRPAIVRTRCAEDYRFRAVLGRGNFGKVMLAEERATGGLVAIKVLKKDAAVSNDEVEALKQEREVFIYTSEANHPFLIRLHACFTTPSSIFFVMDYILGGDLMSLIQRLRMFTPEQAKFYSIEVLMALEFFHSKNVIYRDLKLDNIMLDKDGHIRLADYGLCKLNMRPGSYTTTFCGTPEFMAPEILVDRKYGQAVDFWALGVLLYQMILGMSPFTGADEDEIFDSIMDDEVLYPPTLPRATISIMEKLLTRNPKERIGSGPMGSLEIRNHPYFSTVDWDAHYSRKVRPPYIPRVRNSTDLANFDEEFTSQPPTLTPASSILSPMQQKEFNGFEFTPSWAS